MVSYIQDFESDFMIPLTNALTLRHANFCLLYLSILLLTKLESDHLERQKEIASRRVLSDLYSKGSVYQAFSDSANFA